MEQAVYTDKVTHYFRNIDRACAMFEILLNDHQWQQAYRYKNIVTSVKKTEGSGSFCLRSESTVPFNVEKVYDIVQNPAAITEWDVMCSEGII